MSQDIEARMQNLAMDLYGTSDLGNFAPGLLEWLEKAVDDGHSMGNT